MAPLRSEGSSASRRGGLDWDAKTRSCTTEFQIQRNADCGSRPGGSLRLCHAARLCEWRAERRGGLAGRFRCRRSHRPAGRFMPAHHALEGHAPPLEVQQHVVPVQAAAELLEECRRASGKRDEPANRRRSLMFREGIHNLTPWSLNSLTPREGRTFQPFDRGNIKSNATGGEATGTAVNGVSGTKGAGVPDGRSAGGRVMAASGARGRIRGCRKCTLQRSPRIPRRTNPTLAGRSPRRRMK